jgi:DUF1680 family protein
MAFTRRQRIRRQLLVGLATLGLPHTEARVTSGATASAPAALPLPISSELTDQAELSKPSAVRIEGWLGARITASAKNRLLNIDMKPLLAGFQQKPGSHPWIGEHVGKWLHAASLTWANNNEPALRAKLDRVAAELIAAQESDGYLGTYVPEKRFGIYDGADWDVWSHKYCLIGLLTYHQYTGDAAALGASIKIADLLIDTFPAKRSILAAGTHLGMAATSVLEPIVLLYRITADQRYLDFARYLVNSWDEEKGPAIVKTLLKEKQVSKVANAKAYEMLSNLVGLCELARVTGENSFVDASLIAWQDIVDRRLYATGTTSQWEHFQADHDMRSDVRAHIGETCVTTTWIQFNLALLQLTGEARFGDELERSFYNHLTAAQHPEGDDWCYFTALDGKKKYDKEITCCHSSGPRGLALAPQAAYLRVRHNGEDVLLVNTFETSRVTLTLGGERVTIEQLSGFPVRGDTLLTLRLTKPATFAVKMRSPEWARPMTITGASTDAGWALLPSRRWQDGDVIRVKFNLASRIVQGEHGHAGRAALAWGPFVLAMDQIFNAALPASHLLGLTRTVRATAVADPANCTTLTFEAEVIGESETRLRTAKFFTFADAGRDRGNFRIWLRAPGVDIGAPVPGVSLLIGGIESRSRPGNLEGSIIDEEFDSLVNTYNGQLADEDWFAVTLKKPAKTQRIVFTHGKNSHDGGWFNTQTGKPRVQIRRTAEAAWETIGVLDEYPLTTASSPENLERWNADAQFTLRLKSPVTFVALRVIGKPACGDNPTQAFATCTALQAFSA